jgi:hypothetical protein
MRPRKSLLFLILLSAILVQRSDPLRDRNPAVEVRWRFDAGGCLTHTPTPAGEVVYVASGNGIGWQLERATGKVRWIARDPRLRGGVAARPDRDGLARPLGIAATAVRQHRARRPPRGAVHRRRDCER